VGIVTMRPSDVATYVEAGAADVGVTGKDVLTEQDEREVVELLDLGYGPCRMILATIATAPGRPDPAAASTSPTALPRPARTSCRSGCRAPGRPAIA
jgi:ATP phosphoribosyltransferase